jgi:hypothetical protein
VGKKETEKREKRKDDEAKMTNAKSGVAGAETCHDPQWNRGESRKRQGSRAIYRAGHL